MDEARRQIGMMFDAIGFGPQQSPHCVAAKFEGAQLLRYMASENAPGPVLLIIPAPFKRSYIWDLMPEVSVVRRYLERGFRVYMLDWLIPDEKGDGFGLAEYASEWPNAAVEVIRAETGARAPIVAGHSLGGTFAAIFAALFPHSADRLILVDCPLAFGAHGGPLGRALAAIPHAKFIRALAGSPVPGTAINMLTAMAAPEIFQLQRLVDLGASCLDPLARAIHIRVERWACDEFPIPGRLFEDILESLYRQDRFLEGTLELSGRKIGLGDLRVPLIAVVNHVGGVVPASSLLEGIKAAPLAPTRILDYSGDRGPMIQHLGPLVTPRAHREIWPAILDWAGKADSALAAEAPPHENKRQPRNKIQYSALSRGWDAG